MVTVKVRNRLREYSAMFEGPAMVIFWLMTPAFAVMGSFGAGLAFDAISKLWVVEREGNSPERT